MSGPTSQDVLDVLRSIDASLKTLVARAALPAFAPVPAVGQDVADDRDLDSQWGDEEVKVSPRDWTGPNMKGRRMSECPADFLEMLAGTFDYFARKNSATNETTTSGKPKADFDRRSAARARGWARRLRNGWQAPTFDAGDDFAAPAASAEPAWVQGSIGDDDDLPF